MATTTKIPDLADYDHPVSDFLALSGDSWPVTDEAVAKYSLSPEQLAQYRRDGFLDGIQILNDAQIDRLRADLAEIMNPAHPKHALWHEYNENEAPKESGLSLFHSLGAWRISDAFHDILFLPAYLVPASQLMGADVLHLWHDQIFSKPPRNGSVVAWHQDYSYWSAGVIPYRHVRVMPYRIFASCRTRTKPMQHMTVHITLDDQTEENGVLMYVPGSHTWPLLPITSRNFGDMDSIRTVLNESQLAQFERRHMAALRCGQAAFHHPLTVHGSYSNRSAAPRRATVVNLFAHGTLSDADEPLLEGLPAYPKGTPLEGKFFPVLYGSVPKA